MRKEHSSRNYCAIPECPELEKAHLRCGPFRPGLLPRRSGWVKDALPPVSLLE
jgi:hypothetical protein